MSPFSVLVEDTFLTICNDRRVMFLCHPIFERYRQFLWEVCEARTDFCAGESGTDVSYGDWSSLRCRVEEGIGRMSKVLEDGSIQVDTLALCYVSCCLL